MGKKRGLPAATSELEDWVVQLAAKNTSTDQAPVGSKAERIEKRSAKKQRRQERQAAAKPTLFEKRIEPERESKRQQRGPSTKQYLTLLTHKLQQICNHHMKNSGSNIQQSARKDSTLFKHFKKLCWDVSSIQPRPRDYGGIGLARPSLFLGLNDPSFPALLEQEFEEHIPGFFGKQRTKAMKKQLNKDMLWKILQDNKDLKVNGKKLSDMKPDERVEAMIKAGLV
jgi:hypothetical protein